MARSKRLGADPARSERWAMGRGDRARSPFAVAVVSDETVIRDDESWLDVPLGGACTVAGKLESVGYGKPGSVIIAFADWSMFVLDCDNPQAAKSVPIGAQVRVRAIRDEDGLKATVLFGEGLVPIPLNHNTTP